MSPGSFPKYGTFGRKVRSKPRAIINIPRIIKNLPSPESSFIALKNFIKRC